ncbi:MAG: hypothetical protein LBU43_03750 [Candidatus Accumulibacter sp.]|jgi:hypothetical protein|nr:hypothetical protein [Accumulibacter sp.]
MKSNTEFYMTVEELASSTRLNLDLVKAAANTKSSLAKLTVDRLDAALEHLKRQLSFQPKNWNLTPLDGFHGPWVDSLRELYSVPVAFPASLPPSQGIQIRDLILREKPARVLEIGCFIGISSHWMASALDEIGGGGAGLIRLILSGPNIRYLVTSAIWPIHSDSRAVLPKKQTQAVGSLSMFQIPSSL